MTIHSFFLLLIAAGGRIQAQPCNNDTESLFRVDFDITSEESSAIRHDQRDVYWGLWHSSNGTMIRDEWYPYTAIPDIPAMATQCIPKWDCIAEGRAAVYTVVLPFVGSKKGSSRMRVQLNNSEMYIELPGWLF